MSRNKREGRYFGKVNGQPKRVPAGAREKQYSRSDRKLFNFGFRRVA